MKITFKSEESKKLIYRDYSNFSSECFKGDFVPSICQEKHNYSDFKKKFIATLENWDISRQSKTRINKTLRKAIMKRSHLRNKASKTRNATDVSNYKKQKRLCGKTKQSV